jgi:hypothetical protein
MVINEAHKRYKKAVLGETLATSNANVVVRNVAHLGVAGAHALESKKARTWARSGTMHMGQPKRQVQRGMHHELPRLRRSEVHSGEREQRVIHLLRVHSCITACKHTDQSLRLQPRVLLCYRVVFGRCNPGALRRACHVLL